jgi:transcriptional regulator with XRE-family HTH domain
MKTEKSLLSERLILLRKEHNFSQYKLAEKLGFSRGLIANYEQGQREPDYNTLLVFASFYKVSVDYLLGRTEDKNALYAGTTADGELLDTISSLSDESKKDLHKFIKLLKLSDSQKKL